MTIKFKPWQESIAREFSERHNISIGCFSPSHTWYGVPYPIEKEGEYRQHCRQVVAEVLSLREYQTKALALAERES